MCLFAILIGLKVVEMEYMSQEGYDKLVEELKWREGEERERIKSDIVTARGFGDLSENAEYDAARTAQAQNESRVSELKAMIENADVREVSTMAHGSATTSGVIPTSWKSSR